MLSCKDTVMNSSRTLIVAIWVLLLPAKVGSAQVVADVAFVGGKIWTVDAARPEAEAVAVWHDRILAVGSSREIATLIGPATCVVRLAGRRLLPGFGDCHVHLLGGGLQLNRVDLKDAADEAEFGRRLTAFDRRLPPGRWMLGGNWDHDRTFDGRLPTAKMLDRYVPSRPCLLVRYDGHMALASSSALALAGVTRTTAAPAGGEIHRDPTTHEPTGILRDTAMRLVDDLLPASSDDEMAEAVEAALDLAGLLGGPSTGVRA